MESHYQICFYVPVAQCEEVKQAMYDAGAGTLGNYKHCSWQVLGQGQFRPMKDSQPFLGENEKLEIVAEYKVEMFCVTHSIGDVIQELLEKHPYEEPAYSVIKLESFK